jgi:hypothetical protein
MWRNGTGELRPQRTLLHTYIEHFLIVCSTPQVDDGLFAVGGQSVDFSPFGRSGRRPLHAQSVDFPVVPKA